MLHAVCLSVLLLATNAMASTYTISKGQKLYFQSDYVGALQEFRAAYEEHKDNPMINYFIGLCFERLRQDQEAIEAFGHAIALKPDYKLAKLHLARVYYSLGAMGECAEQVNSLIILGYRFKTQDTAMLEDVMEGASTPSHVPQSQIRLEKQLGTVQPRPVVEPKEPEPVIPVIPDERRIALVVGNSHYGFAPLDNPVNDANDVSAKLRQLNFEVQLVTDADRKEMVKAINRFGDALRTADVGLFYYAGHGIQVKGVNYLVPVDAKMASEGDVEFETVHLGRVLAKMEESQSLNIAILDACRDNPFARGYRSVSRGLARVDAPMGSIVAYATAPGAVAADGDGRNGVYTKFLLKNLSVPGLRIEEVLKRVRIDVLQATGNKQVPWESTSLVGNFMFVGTKAESVQ
ncbi:hypothetical protein JCM14722_29860 [Pseudodesulfovibrio portus]|uniref:Caspase family p20 domain-containing protein n=1 Tax=Pseudodesulfovibrio portus TaxID=231439 RepID=A0ABN6RXN9_9BACT|nr:hypothetical protein JCM14722_29860 [Pseudodesulfovibrio portus]